MRAFVVGEAKIVKKVIIWRDKIPARYIFAACRRCLYACPYDLESFDVHKSILFVICIMSRLSLYLVTLHFCSGSSTTYLPSYTSQLQKLTSCQITNG